MSSIVLDIDDHVARITIDRAERMNAFDINTHEFRSTALLSQPKIGAKLKLTSLSLSKAL